MRVRLRMTHSCMHAIILFWKIFQAWLPHFHSNFFIVAGLLDQLIGLDSRSDALENSLLVKDPEKSYNHDYHAWFCNLKSCLETGFRPAKELSGYPHTIVARFSSAFRIVWRLQTGPKSSSLVSVYIRMPSMFNNKSEQTHGSFDQNNELEFSELWLRSARIQTELRTAIRFSSVKSRNYKQTKNTHTVMIKLRSFLSGLQRLRSFSQFVKLDNSNYFKVFDFKSEFTLDEERLAKVFKSMQMLYHPDKTARLDQVRGHSFKQKSNDELTLASLSTTLSLSLPLSLLPGLKRDRRI